ncbi:hypothetical protein, partial [Dysgonomonas sp. 520]|uniref:hypothetical protein n=1 Tax=Dysgonomonas sp. 520 TaxID=2302931 RepID=UPI0013D66205
MKKQTFLFLFLSLFFSVFGQNIQTEKNRKLVVTYLGQQGDPLSDNNYNAKALSNNSAVVTFEQGKGVYALDQWNDRYKTSVKIRQEYDKLADDYYASWKFLPVGGSDKVVARVEIAKGNPADIDPGKIIFSTPQGTRFDTKLLGNNEFELTVAAGQDKDVQEVFALYPKNGSSSSYLTLGKLNVVTYQKQTNKLVVVQVGTTVNGDALEKGLNAIYNPVGVEWQVVTDEFSYKGDISTLIDEKSGMLEAYNDQMNALISAYKADNNIDSKTSYIFLLKENKSKNGRNVQAFMPRGKQFGFVFSGGLSSDKLSQVVAHELGHGRWRLQHIFDNTYGYDEKNDWGKIPENLMDYADGTQLAKWQWEQLNDPAWFTNPFDGDESGM